MWTVYIIETQSGKFYTGITTDLEKRFAAHRQGKGARFFRFSQTAKIVFQENHATRSEALKREYAIKQLKREQKMKIIEEFRVVHACLQKPIEFPKIP